VAGKLLKSGVRVKNCLIAGPYAVNFFNHFLLYLRVFIIPSCQKKIILSPRKLLLLTGLKKTAPPCFVFEKLSYIGFEIKTKGT
jgi:hypothetical protein